MAKNDSYAIGTNVQCFVSPENHLVIEVDLNAKGQQTKGSREPGKAANELVGSTSTYVGIPGTTARLMLHLIRPMTVQDTRKARAMREVEDEDGAARVASSAKLNADDAKTIARLKAAGVI